MFCNQEALRTHFINFLYVILFTQSLSIIRIAIASFTVNVTMPSCMRLNKFLVICYFLYTCYDSIRFDVCNEMHIAVIAPPPIA